MDIVIATTNLGKLKEYREMLEKYSVNCLSLKDINFDMEIVEDGNTFKENSYIKAKAISDYTNLPVIADDSGLSVDALGGLPGIYSARFSGLEHNDKANRLKLIDELHKLNLSESKAHFTCAITYINNGEVIQTEGYVYGKVIDKEIGSNGFGYDSMFIPDGYNTTVGEIDEDSKNNISHRHNALIKLIEVLFKWERLYLVIHMEVLI